MWTEVRARIEREVMATNRTVLDFLKERYGDKASEFQIPPPVFDYMDAEFVDFDPNAGWLVTRFPVKEAYLNPYGAMQGGFIAAAVDNTLGPLSMLVAPPNVTRRLEMKYSRAVTIEMGEIVVKAEFLGQDGRWLDFKGEVRSQDGDLLARGWAKHWIMENS